MDLHHILAIPADLVGHMVPMLNLLCKFVSASVCKKVTLLINQDKLDTLNDIQQQLEENGHLLKGVISAHAINFIPSPPFTGGDEQLQRTFTDTEEKGGPALILATKLANESNTVPVTCVLGDYCFGWAQDVANQIGVPRFVFSVQPLAELTIVLHMPTLISEGNYNPYSDENYTNLIHVPGLPPLRASDIPQISHYPSTRKAYWSFITRQYDRAFKEAKAILVNSCYDLEKNAYDYVVQNHGIRVHFVGPLLTPPPKTPSSSPCLEWLHMKAAGSVVYISFGSFLKWTSSELEEILFGIEESAYNFLLAFRGDVLVDEASEVLNEFVERFSKPSSQGFIVPWAPQVEVLNHASTGSFFTHYGWNSVVESMSAGVPMMGKPVLGDQLVLRRLAIEEWKIAVDIEEENGRLSKNAIKGATVKLMQDKGIKANAENLKRCVQRAVREKVEFNLQ